MSEVDHPIHQQFSDEELRAIVDEAKRAERVVAAHCHGKPGILAALRAGVSTIEHGSCLDEECVALMQESNAILVPTRYIVNRILSMVGKGVFAPYAEQKALSLAEQHAQAIKLAYQNGVCIAMGTDIATTPPNAMCPYGEHAKELSLLMECTGMSAMEAITCATSNGPLTLGPQAPRSGRLEVGYDADMIAVTSSPLDDIRVLEDHTAISHVWLAGRLVKSDGNLVDAY